VAAWKAARPALTVMAVGVDPTADGLRAHAHGGVVGERDARPAADGRWRLRDLARLRSALRRAGPAM